MKKLVIVCVVTGILLSITSVAHAVATSNNKAVLYWNTFSYSYTGTGLTWLNTESKSLAAADDKNSVHVFNDDFSVGWVDTSATASVPNAWATAWTKDTELGQEVYAGNTGQQVPFWAESEADAWRSGEFIVAGDGTFTSSINFYLEQTLNTETMCDLAVGFSKASLLLENKTASTIDDDNAFVFCEIFGGPVSGMQNCTDTFTVSLDFIDGDIGYISADALSNAYVESIPAPCAILLGGIGVGLVGWLKRRRTF